MSTESNNPLRPGVMSTNLIKQLVDNYRENHLSAINHTLGIEDAHSIWFDLPKLKRFIAMIEEEANRTNPDTTEEDLGIRFYYASYPKIENWDIMDSHPVPKEYAEKHTLVMVPTLKKENEAGDLLDYDFNSLQANGDKIALALNARKPMLPDEGTGDNPGLGENNGQLTPPKASLGESY